MLEDLSRSELAVYVGSGVFVIAVFATALVAIGRATPISFNTWTTVAIMTGFTL